MAAGDTLKVGIEATLTNAVKIRDELKKALEDGLVSISKKDEDALTQRIKSLQQLMDAGLLKQARKGAEELNTLLLRLFNNIHTETGGISNELADLFVKLNQAEKALAKHKSRATESVFRNGIPKRGALTEAQQAQVQTTFGLKDNWNAATAVHAGRLKLAEPNITDAERKKVEAALKLLGYQVVEGQLKLIEGLREAYDKQYKETLAQLQAKADAAQANYNTELANTETTKISADGNTFNDKVILDRIIDSTTKLGKATQQYNEEVQKEAEVTKQATDREEEAIDAADRHAAALNKNNNAIGKAVSTFFGYQMVLRQLRRLWREAISTIKELDKQLTNQAIVTGMTREETWQLVSTYQQLADATGLAQTTIAGVTTEYLRQGESLQNALTLTKAAAAAATVAGISAQDSVKYLTTAIHGFKLEAEDALAVSDKFAALAVQAATNYEDLAIALSKVASQAALAGMSMDYTLALLTTGLDVTQEAPESIGTALKTVIARMREISDYGKTLEDGIDINQVEDGLHAVNIELRTSTGELRSTEAVLDELGHKWETLTANQQAAVAKALAGTRQQSRLVAIMENYEKVLEYQETAGNSIGATTAQQVTYLKGMEAALNRLQNAYQSFIEQVVKSDEVIGVVNFLSKFIKQITKFLSQPAGRFAFITSIVSLLLKSERFVAKIKAGLDAILQRLSQINNKQKDVTAEGEKHANGGKFEKAANITSRVLAGAAILGTVMSWITEIMDVVKNAAKEAAQEQLERAKEIQSDIYNNTQTITSINKLNKSFDTLNKKVVKTAEDMQTLSDIRTELITILGLTESDAANFSTEYLRDRALAKKTDLESQNTKLIAKFTSELMGKSGVKLDGAAIATNIITKTGAGAGLGLMTGNPVVAIVGGIVGAAAGGIEEIIRAVQSNDNRQKITEALKTDDGVKMYKTLLNYNYQTVEGISETLTAGLKSTYAGIIDLLDGAEIESLFKKSGYNINTITSKLQNILLGLGDSVEILNDEFADTTDKTDAVTKIYTRLNQESPELAAAFERSYAPYIKLAAYLDTTVSRLDEFGWSVNNAGELINALVEQGLNPQQGFEALANAMTDATDPVGALTEATKGWSRAAVNAAIDMITSGQSMQDIADQETSARNKIKGLRDTQAKWGEMSASERRTFIDDNAAFFRIPGAREAFMNGQDITPYIAQYRQRLQDDLRDELKNQLYAAHFRLNNLEKQKAEAMAKGDDEALAAINNQIEDTINNIKDLEDELEGIEHLFDLTLSEVVDKQNEQLDKLKEMYQAEEEALVDSLNKRKEAYQKYFDDLAEADKVADYSQSRDRLIENIAKLSGGTDAASRNKVRELQKQLATLEKEEMQRQKEEARQAVLDNIDKQVESIEAQFGELLKDNKKLLARLDASTKMQYFQYLESLGLTDEDLALRKQQLADLLDGIWTQQGIQPYDTITTEVSSPTTTTVNDRSVATTNITVGNQSESVTLTPTQMNEFIKSMLSWLNSHAGTSFKY